MKEQASKQEAIDTSQVDWYSVLPRLGVDPKLIANPRREGPCPIENGGKTRFRFDNKGGRGTWFCSHCGAGDGVNLIARVNGWTEARAFAEMANVHLGRNGLEPIKPRDYVVKPVEKSDKEIEAAKRNASRAWNKASAISGTPTETYLKRRVRDLDPAWVGTSIRHHPSLKHYDGETDRTSHHPAMVARVVDASNPTAVVTLHRTYLSQDGMKAKVSDGQVKKLMATTIPGKINGESIRLNTAVSKIVVVTEGIENGYAWVAATNNTVEVYAAINCSNLGNFKWPKNAEMLIIAADHDAIDVKTGLRPGTHYAKILRERAVEAKLRVAFRVPPIQGMDWDDMWNAGDDLVSTRDRRSTETT